MSLDARDMALLFDIVLAAKDAKGFVEGLDWLQFQDSMTASECCHPQPENYR